MNVEQLWVGNAYRNFNYLVACPETGDALAIDPLDYEQCLRVASEHDWTISQIVNTHEHGDHTGGNKAMVKATGAKIIAHHNAVRRIPNVGRTVGAGDIIEVGTTVKLECLDTPGHTMSHVCLLSKTEPPALFCGDTLFNAGAGNCHNGGHPEELYRTFTEQLGKLPDNTLIYPGHDYLVNNLQFTLDREPGNDRARDMLEKYAGQDPAEAHITTLSEEREINTFFRLEEPGIVDRLHAEYGGTYDPKAVFLKLRELRNSW